MDTAGVLYRAVAEMWIGGKTANLYLQGFLLFCTLSMNICFLAGGLSLGATIAFLVIVGLVVFIVTLLGWYFTKGWVGAMFIVGTLFLGFGVGFSSNFYYAIQDRTDRINLNATVPAASTVYYNVMHFVDSPYVDVTKVGEKVIVSPTNAQSDYYCVAPITTKEVPLNHTTKVHVWAYCYAGKLRCQDALQAGRDCLKKWTEPIDSGVRIEKSSIGKAKDAIRDVAKKYGVEGMSSAAIIYWDDPSHVFSSWNRSYILSLALSNGIWLFITLIFVPHWIRLRLQSSTKYQQV